MNENRKILMWNLIAISLLSCVFITAIVSNAYSEERNISYSSNFLESAKHSGWQITSSTKYDYTNHDRLVYQYEQFSFIKHYDNSISVNDGIKTIYSSSLVCNWVNWC